MQQQNGLYDTAAAFDRNIRAAIDRGADSEAERLLKEKLAFVSSAFGRDDGSYRDAMTRLSSFYMERQRFKEAEPYLTMLLAIAMRDGPGFSTMEVRLELAEALEGQRRWSEATPHLEEALRDLGSNRGGNKAPVARLGLNLHAQKRYRDAEPLLREAGQAQELADTLEGLGRWADAERVWRSLPTDSPIVLQRLEANLRRQGKPAEATTVAERAYKQSKARQAPQANQPQDVPTRLAELTDMAKSFRKSADESDAKGRTAEAQALRAQAEVIEAGLDRSPNAAARRDEAMKKAAAASQRLYLEQLEREGKQEEANKWRKFYGAGTPLPDASAPGLHTWSGQGIGLDYERAKLAVKQAEAGRFAEAEEGFLSTCPVMRQRWMIDLPMPVSSALPEGSVSASRCFAELALIRAHGRLSAASSVDAQAFEAAQFATDTEAGSALTRSAARAYARKSGAGPTLDEIDRRVKAIDGPYREFFKKWPADEVMKLLNRGESMADLANDSADLERAVRPNNEAIARLLREIQAKVPSYFDLRAPGALTVQDLQSKSGDDARLLNNDEALVLWMLMPGQRQGVVFAVSKERAAWAKMTLTGDEIATRVRKLRAQIDPCAYVGKNEECTTGSLSFDRQVAFELYQALLGQPEIQAVVGATSIRSLLIVPSGVLTTLPPSLLIASQPAKREGLDTSPDGWLGADWLIAKKALTVLPGVSTLKTLRSSPIAQVGRPPTAAASGERLFMFADPDFSGTGASPTKCAWQPRAAPRSINQYFRTGGVDRSFVAALSPLPCTRIEGEELRRQLGGAVYFGREARESQLRLPQNAARLAQAEVVSFATHGLVAGDLGQGEPALVLAAPLPTEKGDDGLLTASEILALKMSADWVLLSACNTASPDASDPNGLSGLSRAFFFAGARGVLVSHWRVSDDATAALVIEAVKRRQAGAGKAVALQQASLALMQGKLSGIDETARGRAAHPSAWAAFTLMGEPR
ncbi:MAG: CHAT domain-containing protein [Betaproteobacteria bacterium]